jgi:hypothetical protein
VNGSTKVLLIGEVTRLENLLRGRNETNEGAIVLAERAADHSRIRAVLRQWGYRESQIQRFLKEPSVNQKLETRCNTTDDQSGKIAHSVS